jgi:two-component system nitrogen regulation sensor histidine kinase NtrY
LTYPGKIRLMLALLAATLFLTAIIARKTYTPLDNLHQTAKLLEENLRKKEDIINKTLNNKASFDQLKSLSVNNQNALQLIKKFSTNKNIWFITLKKDRLDFWSGIKVIPGPNELISEGASFITQPNGYYEAIKKSEGDFSAIFFIPVKANYSLQNQYLQNTFSNDLITENNIELANFSDKNVSEIRSTNHVYLFSVKLKNGAVSPRLFYFELAFWLLTFITLCLLVQNICTYLAHKGFIKTSIAFLALFIIVLRFINLYYNLPDLTNKLDIFDPQLYGSNILFPSLGDLCINILLVCWFAIFLFQHRTRLLKRKPGKAASYALFIFYTIIFSLSVTALLKIFYGLVLNSNISFDVNNVLNLSVFSAIGILILCFSFLSLFIFIEVGLTLSKKLTVPVIYQLLIFFISSVLSTLIVYYYWEFTPVYFLWNILVLLRSYSYRYANRKLNSGLFASIILAFAFISSVMLNHFESIKEKQRRVSLAQRLEKQSDETAEYIFKKIENKIISDPALNKSFIDTLHNIDYLKNRLQKLYFDGYLSKYDIVIHEFNNEGQSISNDKSYALSNFSDMVQFSSFKVSDYFYRENSSFGLQNYFAILPLVNQGESLGEVVIQLKSKSLQIVNSFPALVVGMQIKPDNEFNNYSYAFYSDNKLVSQNGNFIYNLVNTDFKGKLNKFIFKTTDINDPRWYRPFTRFNHLIYKPSDRNVLIISIEENAAFYDITSLTIFFVIMLMFSIIVVIIRWSWIRIKILNFTDNRLKWSFKINFDRILYKTRIQFSMVFAVVITLVLVGFITYISITTQYLNQQDLMIKDKITRITDSFEAGELNPYLQHINEETQLSFDHLADFYSTDLILFDKQGTLLITTQPKIYAYGLLSNRMNAQAYISLNKLQNSEFINDETLGTLSYKSAYAPLRNPQGDVMAYLQLPYFSNKADYMERIGALLNIMINIYALIFIAIGLFAVIIARQITAPLNFIQNNLAKIIYGKKNEPIRWDRDDEIGALVREYNNMIAALENSAQKLAQSERESAWREMAKQVAHEIKNPLTPLKLGLQLLEKSWRDKDPKFDQKFERFSKSFVEQIESLSSIASEFSAFAKMPDTRIERINIFNMLNQAVTIFKQMDNLTITYRGAETPFYINADRDQLLRCFNNLLKNAIEATPPDRHGLINIDYVITEKNILLTIKDNGNGIPENMREKIFEPNFTTKSSGTGLGLAFVKNSIENAGGKVWFETSLGVGTTFFFNLPAAD